MDRSYRFRITGRLFKEMSRLSKQTGISALEIVRFGMRVAVIALKLRAPGNRLVIVTPANLMLVQIPIPEDRSVPEGESVPDREGRPMPGLPG